MRSRSDPSLGVTTPSLSGTPSLRSQRLAVVMGARPRSPGVAEFDSTAADGGANSHLVELGDTRVVLPT
ncbi:MAG: hypothetical protein ACRDTX_03675 [Pseudonocardiaceae bacterium]